MKGSLFLKALHSKLYFKLFCCIVSVKPCSLIKHLHKDTRQSLCSSRAAPHNDDNNDNVNNNTNDNNSYYHSLLKYTDRIN